MSNIEEIDAGSDFVVGKDVVPDIMVVGVGGGGNNAINNMYKQNIKKVSFVVCNTDRQALDNSSVPTKLLLGPNTTFGRGAGNVPSVGRAAAEESVPEIDALFDSGTKMVFITAGMGGGTGTGAAPVVARVAKERGLLTIGIVTIPFLFEGETKILKALDGADEMSKYVDALLVINNERLSEIYSDLTFFNAFGKADDTLTTAARSISELINEEGYINLDFNDVDTTLRNGGAAIISSGYGEGENRVTKAIQDALNSPLLKNRDIMSSKKLLFNIYFSKEAELTMSETNEITTFVTSINPSVDVIWGATLDTTLGQKVKITILASGFDVSLREDAEEVKPKTVVFDFNKKVETKETAVTDAKDRLKGAYGGDKIDNLQREKESKRYIVLTQELMDDDSIVEAFEKTPTYNRDKEVAEELRARIKAVVDGKETSPSQSKEESPSSEGQMLSFI